MNKIEQLQDYIKKSYPTAVINLEPPLHKDGIWSLDIDLDEIQLAIQWSADTKFGVSNINSVDATYGSGPDEIFDQLELTQHRINELLAGK